MNTEITIEDEATFNAAIADVRSDTNDINYAVFGHVDGNPNVICSLFTGTDNSEVGSRMDESQMMYSLVRYETQFDMSTTVKFVYFQWLGSKVPFAKRGRYGVVRGNVTAKFEPFHIQIEASSPDDMDREKILQELNEKAGTKSKVLEEGADLSGRQMRGFTQTQLPQRNKQANFGVAAVSTKGASVDIQPDVYEALARVRSDEDSATWMVAGYEGGSAKGPVSCMGVGEGGLDNLMECMDDSVPMYALYRISHTDTDEITTVKFVYIAWCGQKVKAMTKGKISTHKGEIEGIFHPAHVSVFATELSEIDERDIMAKVKAQVAS